MGAVLLDFSVSPLFLWDTFSASLSRELHTPAPELGFAYSVGLAAFTAGVLIGGRLADAVAPRRLALVTGGGVVAGLGVTAVAPSLPVLGLGFGIVLGGATGIGYATAVRVAGTVSTRRGGTVAIVVSAYAAGAVVLAPVVDILLNVLGRTGMFISLAALLGVLVTCSGFLLPAFGGPPGRRLGEGPPGRRLGEGPPGRRLGEGPPGRRLGEGPPGRRLGEAPRGRAASSGIAAVLPYRVPILALWTMFLLGSAPALIAFGHAGQFARAPELTVVAVLLLNAGNFAGRLIAGPVADRIGHTPTLHITAGVLVAACAVLAVTDHPTILLSALLVLGLQYGAVSVLTPVAVAGPVPADRFGTAYGIVFSGWGLVGFAGPVAAAWLATAASYPAVAGVLIGVAVLFWGAVLWVSTVLRRTTRSAD